MKTSDTTLDVQEEVGFPGLFRPERVSLLLAFLISLACFGLYTSCVGSVSMPGTPAASLTQIAGISPNLTSRYLPWRWLMAHLLPFFGDNLVYGANLISAAFGALSVGLLYLVVYVAMSLSIGSEGLGATLKNPRVEADRLSIVAGLFSSAALAVSIPFWFSSTQVYPHAFYLFLMLLALYLMLRYMAYESKGSLLVFCLLWAWIPNHLSSRPCPIDFSSRLVKKPDPHRILTKRCRPSRFATATVKRIARAGARDPRGVYAVEKRNWNCRPTRGGPRMCMDRSISLASFF